MGLLRGIFMTKKLKMLVYLHQFQRVYLLILLKSKIGCIFKTQLIEQTL